MRNFADIAADTFTRYKLMNIEYTDEVGYPIAHLFARDGDGNFEHIRVKGHQPSFYISEDEYDERVDNHYAVVGSEHGYESVNRDSLVRIYTKTPGGVGDMKKTFEKTWEADVLYPNRFLIDTDIYVGFKVNDEADTDEIIDVDDIEPCDPPEVEPRMITVDIEVASTDGFPDATEAAHPVSTIVAHDSYTDQYAGWLLAHDKHDLDAFHDESWEEFDQLAVVADESDMLNQFNNWVSERQPDLLSGWYCVPKDEPVQMADGSQKPIKEVEVGDSVVGKEGEKVVETKVRRKANTGMKDIVKINTQLGESVRLSKTHPILVADEEAPRYVEAQDVEGGQYVLTPKSLPSEGSGGPDVEEAYQLGLIASDGSFSRDNGVVFYNNCLELHDAFDTDNSLSEANGVLRQRVFTDTSREKAVERCERIGLPAGRKDKNKWNLETVYRWRDEAVSAFLGGMLDGDGHISSGRIGINNGNDSARYWIRTLLRSIGIWATDGGDMEVNIGSSSVERFRETVGKYIRHPKKCKRIEEVEDGTCGRECTVPPYMDRGEGTGTDERRIVNDKKRRGINIKRHEIDALGGDSSDHELFVFDKVTSVEKDGEEECYDIETGTHNFITQSRVVHNCDGFDFPYLINRCRELSTWSFKDWSPMGEVWDGKYGPVVKGVTTFDMLDGYKKTQHHELDSKALDSVAEDVLGETKVELDRSHTEMWIEDPITFLKYNKVDVELVIDIEDEMGIIELYENMRKLTGAQFDDCHAPIDMLDVQFLRAAQENGIVLPTATRPDQSWFLGAAVLDPKPGVHDNVVYLDLSSLYPNLIKLLNVSPERIIGFDEPDNLENVRWSYVDTRPQSVKEDTDPEPEKFYYDNSEPGFISGFVDDNIKLKEPYRGTSMYIAVKMVVNAIWGILGDGDSYGRGFRLFDWRMGESITLAGRRVLQFTADQAVQKLHERGYTDAYAVIGDTDGCGVAIPSASPEEAVSVAESIADDINDEYPAFVKEQFNADENFMEVEMESYASRMLVPIGAASREAKKRYGQLIDYEDGEWLDEPELEIKGLEYVRSDTAKITGIAQKQLLDIVFEEDDIGDAKARFSEWLTETVSEIKDGVYDPQKLGRPKGIGQPLDQYGTADRSPQSTYRGAKYANENIYDAKAIGEGDKPMLFYVDRVGGELPKTYSADTAEDGRRVDAITVLDGNDLPNEVRIDYEKMIEKTLRKPLNRLLEPMGADFDDMLRDDEQADIASFM